MGDAPHHRGLTAGTPRPAAPARSSGPRRRLRSERPTEKKGRIRRPATRAPTRVLRARPGTRAPRAPTRVLRAHRRVCSARTDAHTPRTPMRTLRVLRRAYPARLPAHRPARLPTCNRHVLQRAPDASTDAYSARLEARSRHASAACEVLAFWTGLFWLWFCCCDIFPVGQRLCSITDAFEDRRNSDLRSLDLGSVIKLSSAQTIVQDYEVDRIIFASLFCLRSVSLFSFIHASDGYLV